MFDQRLRGLVNLHVAASTVLALLLLLTYARLTPYLPFMQQLSGNMNFLPHNLCVAGGMLLSARYVHQLEGRFHRLIVTWRLFIRPPAHCRTGRCSTGFGRGSRDTLFFVSVAACRSGWGIF